MRLEENKEKRGLFMVVFDMESALANRPYVANSAAEVLEEIRRESPADAVHVKNVHLIN